MYYLLDTNVVSEEMRPRPDPTVAAWLGALPPREATLSTITFGEIQKGVQRLQHGARRSKLTRWLEKLPSRYPSRVLPVSVRIAREWGRIEDQARRSGRALAVPDGLLLATAVVHRLVLVTRNERDFRERGVRIVNPWNP